MKFPRRPRFKRVSAVARIQLTERDCEITRLVHRYRFLRSSQIIALTGGRSQSILRRLQLLYHHGYLERPRAQIDYYHRGGTREMVYGLGNKGAALLKTEFGIDVSTLRAGEKNRAVGRVFLEHALLVSDVMVAFEQACRKTDSVRLLLEHDLPLPREAKGSPLFKWNVNLRGGARVGIIPDRVFGVVSDAIPVERNPAIFFLEADRGTMPVIRKHLAQTSIFRKLLAYETTWSQELHRSKFGFHRFRVLIVTTSKARTESLVAACSHLKRGHGLFLLCDQETLRKHGNIFDVPWRTGRNGQTVKLLD